MAAALTGGFVLTMSKSRATPDLSVSIPAAGYVTHPTAGFSLSPGSLAGRLVETGVPDRSRGLALRTFAVEYGRRWRRSVVIPHLRSEASAPNGDVCDAELGLASSFFDDGGASGGDVAALIASEIRALFPIEEKFLGLFTVRLEAAKSVDVRLRPTDSGLRATATVVLDDGKSFTVSAVVGLRRASATTLKVDVRSVRLERWSTQLKQEIRASGALGRWLSDAADDAVAPLLRRRVEPEVAKRVAATLGAIHLPGAEAVDPARLDDRYHLELCGEPQLSKAGLRLPLRLRAKLADPVRPAFAKLPLPTRSKRTNAAVDRGNAYVSVTRRGLARVLHLMWRTKSLDSYASRGVLRSELATEASRRLNVSLDQLRLQLPPMLDSRRPLGLRVANVEAARIADGRSLWANVDLTLGLLDKPGTVAIGARVKSVSWSCVAERSAQLVYSPCLSDVMPIVLRRAHGVTAARWELPAPLLKRLQRFEVSGRKVAVSGITPELRDGAGLRIEFRVSVR